LVEGSSAASFHAIVLRLSRRLLVVKAGQLARRVGRGGVGQKWRPLVKRGRRASRPGRPGTTSSGAGSRVPAMVPRFGSSGWSLAVPGEQYQQLCLGSSSQHGPCMANEASPVPFPLLSMKYRPHREEGKQKQHFRFAF
jgi:hypothetical protein